MSRAEQLVQVSANLYAMRDKARCLLGGRYREHMAMLGDIISATASVVGLSPLNVAIDIASRRGLAGIDLILVMAAAVELVEPSADAEGGAA